MERFLALDIPLNTATSDKIRPMQDAPTRFRKEIRACVSAWNLGSWLLSQPLGVLKHAPMV